MAGTTAQLGKESNWNVARSHFNALPIIGGIGESIWGSPEQEEAERTAAKIAAELEASRPERADQRMRAMNQSALAFQPMQQLMGGMYGPEAVMDIKGMTQNPLLSQNATHEAFRPGSVEYNNRVNPMTQGPSVPSASAFAPPPGRR